MKAHFVRFRQQLCQFTLFCTHRHGKSGRPHGGAIGHVEGVRTRGPCNQHIVTITITPFSLIVLGELRKVTIFLRRKLSERVMECLVSCRVVSVAKWFKLKFLRCNPEFNSWRRLSLATSGNGVLSRKTYLKY